MKKFIATVSTAALITAALAGPVSAADNAFTDINGSYAKDAIIELQSMGILEGIDATHFAPKDTLTRAQFVTIIVRALGIDANATTSQFSDVKGWATPYVEAAANAGIIQGVGNGMFSPNATLTREEAATILVRALKLSGELGEADTLTFTDAAQISEWARPYIALAVKYGLVQGNPDGTFNPKGSANREMAATMGVNLLGSLDDVKPVTPPVVTPPVVTPPVVTPPVVTPPSGGGVYYPPYTPPVVTPPVVTPPVVEPPVVEPPTDEVDVTVPVITLNGSTVIEVVYGAAYTDAGATADDNKDGDLSGGIVITISNEAGDTIEAIDTTVPGPYTYHYNVSDAAGNAAVEVTRSVVVAEEVVNPPIEADLTAYNEALEAVNEADYTTVSWDAYQVIVAANVVTVTNTQEEVDEATASIIAAQDNLVKIPVVDPLEYVQPQDFGYWVDATPDSAAYNVGFDINLDNLPYSQISKIDVSLVDGSGNVLATRTATGDQITQLIVDDATSGGLDGQLSAAFIYRAAEATNDWWNSTAYDFTTPAKAVISITDTENKVYVVENGSLTDGSHEVSNPLDYAAAQDFGYWNDQFAYNLGFKIDVEKLPYANMKSIEVALVDANGGVLTKRTATGTQITKLASDDETYAPIDGQLSAAFVYREAEATNEWWTSTAYDMTAPSKAVITITDKSNRIIKVESGSPSTTSPVYVEMQDFGALPDDGYNLGFKLNLDAIGGYDNIASITGTVTDSVYGEVSRIAIDTPQRLMNYMADDSADGLDGQLSFDFRTLAYVTEEYGGTETSYTNYIKPIANDYDGTPTSAQIVIVTNSGATIVVNR